MDSQTHSGATVYPAELLAAARGLMKTVNGGDKDCCEAAVGRVLSASTMPQNGDALRFAAMVMLYARRVAERVALTKAKSIIIQEPAPEPEWNIASVLCGDGSTGKSGCRLREGAIFASAAARGGHESFWEIDASSLRLCTQGIKVLQWPAFAVTSRAKKRFGFGSGPTVDMTGMHIPAAKLALVRCLLEWVRKNPGVAVLVGGPRFRHVHAGLKQHLLFQAGRFKWHLPAGRCIDAAIVHAVWQLCGERGGRAALQFMREQHSRAVLTRLRAIRPILHALPVNVETRIVPKEEMAAFQRDAFRWLAEEARGVWLVRLIQRGVVDHCVAIDAFEALILDPAEEFPLRLCAEVLRMCGGSDAQRLQVAEARRIVVHEAKKSKKRKRILP